MITEDDTKFLLGAGSEDDLFNAGFEELDEIDGIQTNETFRNQTTDEAFSKDFKNQSTPVNSPSSTVNTINENNNVDTVTSDITKTDQPSTVSDTTLEDSTK